MNYMTFIEVDPTMQMVLSLETTEFISIGSLYHLH
jgi:hypothetical protein